MNAIEFLRKLGNLSINEAAKALKDEGFSPIEIAQALQTHFSAPTDAVNQAIEIAGMEIPKLPKTIWDTINNSMNKISKSKTMDKIRNAFNPSTW